METLGKNGQDFHRPDPPHVQLSDDVDAGILTRDEADRIANGSTPYNDNNSEVWGQPIPLPTAPTDHEHAEVEDES
jgi:hypothetical protein